jgi:hypothetical protein
MISNILLVLVRPDHTASKPSIINWEIVACATYAWSFEVPETGGFFVVLGTFVGSTRIHFVLGGDVEG